MAGAYWVIAMPTIVIALPASLVAIARRGSIIIFQAIDVPAGLVLHLVQPLPLASRQVAVGRHPVLSTIDATLFPVQVTGFSRG
jgi:hypothetical protein